MKAILICTNKQDIIDRIQSALSKEYHAEVAGSKEISLQMFGRKRYEYTFLEIGFLSDYCDTTGMPNYKEALKPYWEAYPTAPIVVLAPQGGIREAVHAVKAGASSYLTYPFDPAEVVYVIEDITNHQRIESELMYLRDYTIQAGTARGSRTNSPLMKEALDKVHSVAATRSTVLLTGETGTGKNVIAKLIHASSNRRDKPFVAVHCGAIPENLIESELFGHEKGSFTGAVRRKLGKFQIADGGTILLDEVSTISPAVQIKLLQVLQERTFNRVGGEVPIEVDVRIIAATNVELKKLCDDEKFRKDLYYRLNVFPINLPALRERAEDIPLLVDAFLENLNLMYGKEIKGVAPEVMEALKRYSWPGNIRELENIIERAFILERGKFLSISNFPNELFTFEILNNFVDTQKIPCLADVKRRVLEHEEKRYLQEILAINNGRIDRAAATAGITTRQLNNLMTKYGLHKEDFK